MIVLARTLKRWPNVAEEGQHDLAALLSEA